MSISEALKILGLNSNYTEEDLKIAYRKLIVKYHPDKHQGREKLKAEEKTKQINEARDILEKNVRIKNINDKDFYDEMYQKEFNLLRKLKKQYKEEMECELEYIYKIDSRDKIFSKYKEDFLKIIFDFYNYIDSQPSTISIKINYELYKKDFFKVLCDYLNKNYEISKIAYFVNSSLDVEETDNLKSVRAKMNITINDILIDVMNEFKTYNCYKEAEPILLGIRDGFTQLLLWGYLDIETAKNDFRNKILEELIKYIKRKQMIDELITYQGFYSPLAVELYNNILDEEKFNNIYNEHISTGKRIKMKLKKIFSK